MPVAFPALVPTARSYSPGNYPQTQFTAQNGAVTVMRYGQHRVNASLQLEFANISDDKAALILSNYEQVNRTWDYVQFSSANATAGAKTNLATYFAEGNRLRYRYAEPPEVRSIQPGISSVTCRFNAYLDGA